MERLVLKRRLPTNLREQTLNLALHNIKNGNTLQSFLAIQLMITCMYIGKYYYYVWELFVGRKY